MGWFDDARRWMCCVACDISIGLYLFHQWFRHGENGRIIIIGAIYSEEVLLRAHSVWAQFTLEDVLLVAHSAFSA